jgi:hypothetical protein
VVGSLSHGEERYNFGSLMAALIESERKLKELYERTAEGTGPAELKSLVSEYGKNSSKRMEAMWRARVGTVVEMALEPITSLKFAELLGNINSTIQSVRVGNLEKLRTLERMVSKLYAEASPKITQISAQRGELLAALSRESAEHARELERYLQHA